MITLRYQHIRPWCFAYVALPLWIFSVSWLKPLWGFLFSVVIALLVAVTFFKNPLFRFGHVEQPEGALPLTSDDDNVLTFSRGKFAAMLTVVVLLGAVWVWWSGIGG